MRKWTAFFLIAAFIPFPVFSASMGESVSYTVNGEPYEGYYVSPAKGAPLVLIIHDWDGLTDYEIKRAHMLAEMGYAVFAADLFGAGVRPTEVRDKRQHTGELYKDRDKMRALMLGALEEAGKKGADADKAVALGYCFGGAAVLELARSGADLKGPRGEILVMYGTADSAITMDDFAELASELETEGIRHEMVTYSGAPHAFTVFGSDRYREDADKKSWTRFSAFLDEKLK
jgi:dienelactone hydrolase